MKYLRRAEQSGEETRHKQHPEKKQLFKIDPSNPVFLDTSVA